MKVLVTGGSGFLGRRLQKVKPNWKYLSSWNVDLTDSDATIRYIRKSKPDAVVHLAGMVGGIGSNRSRPAEYYLMNTLINTNIVHACQIARVPRLLACLSTCAFPDKVDKYPFTEEDLFKGAPAITNQAYGFSKRALHVYVQAVRDQYGLSYSTFCPSNLYGPGDSFDLDNSHFLSSAIRKIHEAKEGEEVMFWGTGDPLRQFMYADDLAEIIPVLLKKHLDGSPLIAAPDYNYSIRDMIEMCIDVMEKDVTYNFNGDLDGQYRKDGSNAKLKTLLPDVKFTPLQEGIRKTYDWFKESFDNGSSGPGRQLFSGTSSK
jgi:GDP-L-fucose synthase